MSKALDTTFNFLIKTRNEAASAVLIAALDCPQQAVQERALAALLDRRCLVGQKEIVRRLHTINEPWRKIISEHNGRMTHALRDAVLSPDPQLCMNGCQAILWFAEYDLMPALINAAEDEANVSRELAAATLLKLAEKLYDELAGPRDARNRRDPQLVRQMVIGSLEQSVRRFYRHRRSEMIEAFLMLVNRDNVTLKQILINASEISYQPIKDLMSRSPRGGIIRLVLSFLDDPHAPSSAIALISHRGDQKFIECLLRKIGYEPNATAGSNLRRLDHIAWLQADLTMIDRLDDAGQHAAVQLALRSGMGRPTVFKLLHQLLSSGKVGGRRAASAALAHFLGDGARQLALRALKDSDPQVRANILRQLRARTLPCALDRLIEAIDSPYEVEVQAARDSLAEFEFKRFLANFDLMEENLRYTTGAIVRKVDPRSEKYLADEMAATSRTRRMRALSMARAMNLVEALEQSVLERLSDEDHLVRVEAARALALSNTELSRQALHEALADRSIAVQEAAESSLQLLSQQTPKPAASPPVDTLAPQPPLPPVWADQIGMPMSLLGATLMPPNEIN